MIGGEQMQEKMIGSEVEREEGCLTLLLDYNCTWHLQTHLACMTNNACMRSNERLYVDVFSLSRASIKHCLLFNPHQMDYRLQMKQIEPIYTAHEACAEFRTQLGLN